MQAPFESSPPEPNILSQLMRRNVPILLFLFTATAGMLLTYIYFSPPLGTAVTPLPNPFTAPGALSAPLTKPIPDRIVQQRFSQTAAPFHLAIIVGHQASDPGAVCEDGLTELEINTDIAQQVVQNMAARGYPITLFDEFDTRLTNYDGLALVSIHSDSCDYYGDDLTGFKAAASPSPTSQPLLQCMNERYGAVTGLAIHENTITGHMTDYHVFRRIASATPALILESGFMNMDRELLTTNSHIPAEGVTEALLCYLEQIGQ